MVKTVGLLLLISAAAFAQRGGIRSGGIRSGGVHSRPPAGTFGSNTGFGNVVFPGTGQAPALPGAITDPSFGVRLGATVSGFPPYTGVGPGRGGRGRGVGGGVVVLPYPVGVPYYPEPEPPQTIVVYPQQQQSPQVIINQNFTPETARPVVNEYSMDSNGGVRVYDPRTRVNPEPAAAPPPAPAAEAPVYLIAFKDNTIYAALAYWVEGDTLHYVTNRNTHNQVSLDLIDRELSTRLNSEREVEFRLPPPRR
jgi:hypothetical protein